MRTYIRTYVHTYTHTYIRYGFIFQITALHYTNAAPNAPPYWLPSEDGNLTSAITLNPMDFPSLVRRYNLLSTEESFIAAAKFFEKSAPTSTGHQDKTG